MGKVFRDARVGVKAVHHIEQLGECRCLFRQIRCAAAAENQHIDFVLPVGGFIRFHYGDACRRELHICRIPPCEHGHQLHIRIFLHGAFHAASQIAIS